MFRGAAVGAMVGALILLLNYNFQLGFAARSDGAGIYIVLAYILTYSAIGIGVAAILEILFFRAIVALLRYDEVKK
jgi:hypothetical protein